MASWIIPEEDRVRISKAVETAEAQSDGEVMTMVTQSSSRYADWALFLSLVAGLSVLAAMAAFPQHVAAALLALTGSWHTSVVTEEMMGAALLATLLTTLVAWGCLCWMPLRLALTPRRIKINRVRFAAIRAFRIGIESRTRAATGILLYCSIAEHRAELVADSGINAKVADAAWGEAMATLIAEIRAGRPGNGIVQAVEIAGRVLATHFPRSHDDTNEIPDRLIEL